MVEKARSALAELFPDRDSVQEEAGDEQQESSLRQAVVLVTDPGKYGYHLDVICQSGQVVAVAEVMDRQGFFLESIAGVDWPDKVQLEVVYDYNRMEGDHCRVTVRTFIPRNEPSLPTISAVFPAADWHERETFDFYGVHFSGHPCLTRILLPEDADFHPLLKDYMP